MQAFLEEKREEIAELCRTHHVRRLAVFGSAVRDDFDPERSDVDFLVEFRDLSPGTSIFMDNYQDFEEALARLLRRDIDLVRDGVIENPFILRSIRNDKRQLYAA
jgi:predicted nucleotidyltransferase